MNRWRREKQAITCKENKILEPEADPACKSLAEYRKGDLRRQQRGLSEVTEGRCGAGTSD